MKYSKGNIVYTIIPILILGSVAAGGWYYYYAEVNKNISFEKDSQSEFGALTRELEKTDENYNNLVAKQAELKASLEEQRKSQQELSNSLEKAQAENKELKTALEQAAEKVNLTAEELQTELAKRRELTELLTKTQADQKQAETMLEKEVEKISLTTDELKAELEKRQMAQQSLKNEISTVSEEKSVLLTKLEQEQESKRQIANLKNRLEQELNESRVEVSQLKNQMTVIKLTSEVLFGSGSAEITSAGKKVLAIIGDSLNAYPDQAITVEGHTDNIPILRHKKYDSNWELSTARGIAAIQFFQQNNQVDPQRLKVVGYGQYHPLATNDTTEGRQLNRRIEIKLSPPE